MCKDAASHVVIHHVQEIRTGGRYLMEVSDPGKGEGTRRLSRGKTSRKNCV
jgi:hypothetical protein